MHSRTITVMTNDVTCRPFTCCWSITGWWSSFFKTVKTRIREFSFKGNRPLLLTYIFCRFPSRGSLSTCNMDKTKSQWRKQFSGVVRFSYDLEKWFPWVFVICFISQWMKRLKHGLFVFLPKKPLIWGRHCSNGKSCCCLTSNRSIGWFLESSRAWSFFTLRLTN